jgi:hypothetical protein
MPTSPIARHADVEARPAATRRRGTLRRCREALLAAVIVLACLCAVPTAAGASSSTPLLGNTSIPRIPRDGTPAPSDCAAGSVAVGVRAWVDDFPRITGVATWCGDAAGNLALGDVVGDSSGTFGDSRCTGADVATGLFGAAGEVVNAIGVRCGGASTYEAPRVGNSDTATTAADCPAGSGITGLTGWYGDYGTNTNIYGAQGACDALPVLSVQGPALTIAAGAAIPSPLTPSYSGFVNGDTTASLTNPATCSTAATSTSLPGVYPITCSGASGRYAVSYVDGSLTISRVATSLTPEPAIARLLPLQLFLPQLRATLRTSAGTPVANQPVSFKVGGTTVCTATTNGNGVASCTGSIPGLLQTVLGLGYDAVYAGSPVYLPTQAHGALLAL